MLDTLARNWSWFAFRGALAIAFGLAALTWPGITVTVLVLLFGAFSLADGITAIVIATEDSEPDMPAWTLLADGASGVAVAVLTFFLPAVTALVLLFLIATRAIVTGAFQIVAAAHLRREIADERWLAVGGALSIAFGILVVVMPSAGALALVPFIGAHALAFGVIMVLLAVRLHEYRDTAIARGDARRAAGEAR